ncbi:MAG TPA: hypothetical protein VFC18_11360 [Burkholderiales bacterium]|nr:hypothetical protein [Burkholderiales bacterium]
MEGRSAMAQVVSRFTFFPADERQSWRVGRFLTAAGNRIASIG